MKNYRKILSALCALLIALLALTACSSTAEPVDITVNDIADDVSKENAEADSTKGAEDIILALANAQTKEELSSILTQDSLDTSEEILSVFSGSNYSASAQMLGTYNEYDVYNFEVTDKDTNESYNGIGLLVKENGSYLFCNNADILNTFAQNTQCSLCGGTGSIYTGGNACAICGGTGMQYNPQAYYDAGLNMYQGQHVACSGCGGSGKTGATSSVCTACKGACVILN